jgi:hypothetical protein
MFLMRRFLFRKIAAVLLVSMGILSVVPRLEASFIPSEECLSSSFRQKDMSIVKKALEEKLVSERLRHLGYSDKEVMDRLEQLTDSELHKFATRIDSLTGAGDGLGVVISLLVIILLVLVILQLMGKRVTVR